MQGRSSGDAKLPHALILFSTPAICLLKASSLHQHIRNGHIYQQQWNCKQSLHASLALPQKPIPAISSTADMRATMAPSLASLKAPRANVTDSTVGMAIGMPPTTITNMFVRVGQPSAVQVQLQFRADYNQVPACTVATSVMQ